MKLFKFLLLSHGLHRLPFWSKIRIVACPDFLFQPFAPVAQGLVVQIPTLNVRAAIAIIAPVLQVFL